MVGQNLRDKIGSVWIAKLWSFRKVLRDIEQEDSLWQSKVKRKEKQQARKGTGEASPKSSPASTAVSDDDVGEPDPMPSKGRRRPPGFY